MRLEHLGEQAAAMALVGGFRGVLATGIRTADLRGAAGTEAFIDAVVHQLQA